jgi:antitoxin (DNA-binding transcriptional repressor) of toxin-antitoxin stability system
MHCPTGAGEEDGAVTTTAGPVPSLRVREAPIEPVIDYEELREGLQRVLPSALVQATDDAQAAVASLSEDTPAEEDVAVASLAAALGTAAVGSVAAGLRAWLERRLAEGRVHSWPDWLRPALTPDAKPRLATLTQFSQQRTQYVREVLNGAPVLLARHGTVVAAIVPLEPGAFERTAYPSAARRLLEAAAGQADTESPSPELSEAQLAAIRADQSAATAVEHGIDTTGWEALNPRAAEGPVDAKEPEKPKKPARGSRRSQTARAGRGRADDTTQ